eukprot:COSAG06_NODE_2420_length_6905_cov_5.610344_4_plen_189_part_00
MRPGECSTDDAPTLAALHSILPRLLELPQSLTSVTQRKLWSTFLGAKKRFISKNFLMKKNDDDLPRQARDAHQMNQRKQFNSNNCFVLLQTSSRPCRRTHALFAKTPQARTKPPFYLTMIILPRQARDKHRLGANSKRDAFFHRREPGQLRQPRRCRESCAVTLLALLQPDQPARDAGIVRGSPVPGQ